MHKYNSTLSLSCSLGLQSQLLGSCQVCAVMCCAHMILLIHLMNICKCLSCVCELIFSSPLSCPTGEPSVLLQAPYRRLCTGLVSCEGWALGIRGLQEAYTRVGTPGGGWLAGEVLLGVNPDG